MYGPSDDDVRLLLRTLVVVAVVCLAVAFFLGRCTAGWTVSVSKPSEVKEPK